MLPLLSLLFGAACSTGLQRRRPAPAAPVRQGLPSPPCCCSGPCKGCAALGLHVGSCLQSLGHFRAGRPDASRRPEAAGCSCACAQQTRAGGSWAGLQLCRCATDARRRQLAVLQLCRCAASVRRQQLHRTTCLLDGRSSLPGISRLARARASCSRRLLLLSPSAGSCRSSTSVRTYATSSDCRLSCRAADGRVGKPVAAAA